MTAQKRNQIISFNRLIVLALTASGLLMDGFHLSDLVFLVASFVWLWMADCVRIESKWLQKYRWNEPDISEHKVQIQCLHQSV